MKIYKSVLILVPTLLIAMTACRKTAKESENPIVNGAYKDGKCAANSVEANNRLNELMAKYPDVVNRRAVVKTCEEVRIILNGTSCRTQDQVTKAPTTISYSKYENYCNGAKAALANIEKPQPTPATPPVIATEDSKTVKSLKTFYMKVIAAEKIQTLKASDDFTVNGVGTEQNKAIKMASSSGITACSLNDEKEISVSKGSKWTMVSLEESNRGGTRSLAMAFRTSDDDLTEIVCLSKESTTVLDLKNSLKGLFEISL